MFQLILPLMLLFSGQLSEGAVILKKRNKQALLHLEGLETRIGTYFEVLDFKGKPRGILQIRRLSKNGRKAIGVLKSGQMAKSWALEPMSRWAALKQIKKSETRRRQALLKKRRSVRKLAAAGRRNYRRPPPKRKTKRRADRQPSRRYPANMNEDIQEESAQGSLRDEQYVIDDISSSPPPAEDYYNPSFLKEQPEDDMNLSGGFSLMPTGNFMKLKYEDIHLSLSGMGFSGQGFLEGDINDSVRWNVHTGYRRFSVFGEEDLCDGGECFLRINYIIGGAGLKYILKEKRMFKLWVGIQGGLMFLLDYENDVNISFDESDGEDSDNVTITDDSFGMLHGALGLSLGADILFKKNLFFPLALEGYLSPTLPTATVTAGTVGFRLGVGWKF